MQTRTYGDLFKLIQSLAGVSTFAPTETDDIANLINRRYSEAYNTIQMWPRYLVSSEERKIASLTLSNITSTSASDTVLPGYYYKFGEQVQRGTPDYTTSGGLKNNIYAQIGGTLDSSGLPERVIFRQYTGPTSTTWKWVIGNPVLELQSDGSYYNGGSSLRIEDAAGSGTVDEPWDVVTWKELSGLALTPQVVENHAIPYEESPKEKIGEFIRIHKTKAFLNNSSLEYDFFVDFNGGNILNISSTSESTAFVTYKKIFTPFTTSSDYTTSTEEVPGEFFHYIAHAAYSDFLRMDGQHDKAQLEQQNAQQYLALELERVDVIMNQNTVNKRFSTHVNRQSR